jgi:hypothetical protein
MTVEIRLPPILFDLLLLVMTVYKTINTSFNWRRTPLLWLLLRDGTCAFLVVFGQPLCHRRTCQPADLSMQGCSC